MMKQVSSVANEVTQLFTFSRHLTGKGMSGAFSAASARTIAESRGLEGRSSTEEESVLAGLRDFRRLWHLRARRRRWNRNNCAGANLDGAMLVVDHHARPAAIHRT